MKMGTHTHTAKRFICSTQKTWIYIYSSGKWYMLCAVGPRPYLGSHELNWCLAPLGCRKRSQDNQEDYISTANSSSRQHTKKRMNEWKKWNEIQTIRWIQKKRISSTTTRQEAPLFLPSTSQLIFYTVYRCICQLTTYTLVNNLAI